MANVVERSTDIEALRREAAAIKWHHRIELAPGLVTRATDDTPLKLARLGLPASLKGKTVLDIGAWDGFFSFEAERRGAERVVALDSVVWHMTEGGFTGKRGFELARRQLGSRVEDVECEVLDISPERLGGTFDVVFFMGVLYHMLHPMLALERVRSVCTDMVVLETHAACLGSRSPRLAFYPGDELAHDASNWFAPNLAALVGMLNVAGFPRVEVLYAPSFPYRVARAAWWRWKYDAPFWRTIGEGRLIVHAFVR